MHEVPYELEDVLQRLLVDYPDLLPRNQIDRVMPRKCVLVAREQSLRFEEGGPLRWRVDHIFLDQDGIPTLVEVKHSTDPRIRREVVGQMLTANGVAYWPGQTARTPNNSGVPPRRAFREQYRHAADSGHQQ
jgi:hypothetical protein